MIKLRLQRRGRKKRPFYHIVVADSRSPRDGRIIEQLGRFDNVSEKKELTYDEERIIHWLKVGAQPSDTVRSILKHEGILYKMHLMRWGKTEEEIAAALEEWRTARDTRKSEKETSRKAKQKELLKAEEKEMKKQLEEKAAAAARALEKQKEEAEKAASDEEVSAEAEAPAADETVAEEAPATETAAEETPETVEEKPVEEAAEEEETVAEEAPEVVTEPAEEEQKETEAEAKPAEEEKADAEPVEEKPEKEEASAVSTDMTANEAIDHIKNTPLEDLKGFVPEDESRVTVQRALEAKQAE